jgi:hypothetical protein
MVTVAWSDFTGGLLPWLFPKSSFLVANPSRGVFLFGYGPLKS